MIPQDSTFDQGIVLSTLVGKNGRLRTRIDLHSPEPVDTHQKSRNVAFLELRDRAGSFTSYHSYSGGTFWRPVIRELSGKVGERVDLCVKPLTPLSLLQQLPTISFQNSCQDKWGPESTTLNILPSRTGITMVIRGQGSDFPQGEFALEAIRDERLQSFNGRPRLGLSLGDLLGGGRRMAIYYDAPEKAALGIEDGRQFRMVKLIYSDGVRLRVVYRKFRDFNVATIYVSDPSSIYQIDSVSSRPQGFSRENLHHYRVRFRRTLEKRMLTSGSSYDHGRLGVEIAYSIFKGLFQSSSFVIPEISRGGRDLYSQDGTISVQARLIYDFRQFRPLAVHEAVKSQLRSLLRKLRQDFAYNSRMRIGFASISFGDEEVGWLHAILAGLQRSKFGGKLRPLGSLDELGDRSPTK